MLKLQPTLKNYLWGGKKFYNLYGRDNNGDKISESWEVSVHPDGESITENGTLTEYLKNNPTAVDEEGANFPILIKYIDAMQNLSVQVHPNDNYAQQMEGDNGKTEMWYIIDADDGAGIYCGFNKKTSKEEFLQKVKDGTVEDLLNFIPVKKGDCYLIEAGTVHAIGKGCVICEVQQSSNVTYRVYDYNRTGADGKKRTLHIEKAVDVINFDKFENRTYSRKKIICEEYDLQTLTECKYFCCKKLNLKGAYSQLNKKSFTTVNIIDGHGYINGQIFKSGDSFFIDRGENVTITGFAQIIFTTKSEQEYFLGVDIGGSFVKYGIIDGDGRLIDKKVVRTAPSYTEIVNQIVNDFKRIEIDAQLKLTGMGVGCPGTIDTKNGVVIYSNNLNWKNKPLAEDLFGFTKVPVKIINDANAAVLGEYHFGFLEKYKSVVLVTIGTGIGCGIILDGKLFEGKNGAGTEIGHTVIKFDGESCTCGRKGCLEAYASTNALIRQIKEFMKINPESVLWKVCDNNLDNLNGRTLFDAIDLGDKGAKQILNKYIDYLGCGLINIANSIRPDVIIIGGGISEQGEKLTLPLQKLLNNNIFGGQDFSSVKIIPAKLNNDAGIFGSAKLIMG